VAPDARRRLGDAGEALVARWYEAAGYVVVDRNWRCREGELDLVCVLEAVTQAKVRRIRMLARAWLAQQSGESRGGVRLGAASLRFDVASVLALPGAAPVIDVVEGAF
jgi:putative endonuclease